MLAYPLSAVRLASDAAGAADQTIAGVVCAWAAPAHAAAPLAGRSWKFERVAGRAVPAGYEATLAFDRGRVSGRAGCNGFGGRYRRAGARLRFSEIASTLMGCERDGAQPPDLLRVLHRTRFQRRTADRLLLLGARGRTLARLARAR